MNSANTADEGKSYWWQEAEFLGSLPPLPVTFKASRAIPSPSVFLFVCICAFFALPVLWVLLGQLFLVFEGLVPALGWLRLLLVQILRPIAEEFMMLLFLVTIFMCGMGANWWRSARDKRKGRESWCRLTDEGIEYHEPNNHYKFRWSEIEQIWPNWEGDESEYYGIEVRAGRRKFHMGARFFTEQEVKWVHGLCQFKIFHHRDTEV